jgi:hypothetical protein
VRFVTLTPHLCVVEPVAYVAGDVVALKLRVQQLETELQAVRASEAEVRSRAAWAVDQARILVSENMDITKQVRLTRAPPTAPTATHSLPSLPSLPSLHSLPPVASGHVASHPVTSRPQLLLPLQRDAYRWKFEKLVESAGVSLAPLDGEATALTVLEEKESEIRRLKEALGSGGVAPTHTKRRQGKGAAANAMDNRVDTDGDATASDDVLGDMEDVQPVHDDDSDDDAAVDDEETNKVRARVSLLSGTRCHGGVGRG